MPVKTTKTKRVLSRTVETKIGNTVYIITSVFNSNATETAEQKLLRLAAESTVNIICEGSDNSAPITAS